LAKKLDSTWQKNADVTAPLHSALSLTCLLSFWSAYFERLCILTILALPNLYF